MNMIRIIAPGITCLLATVHAQDFKKTTWTPNPPHCFEQGPAIKTVIPLPQMAPAGTPVIKKTEARKYDIIPGSITIKVEVGKMPKPREEWRVTGVAYRIGGTGAPLLSGMAGQMTPEQKKPEFIIIFDYKPENFGKSTTLFSQLIVGSQKVLNGKVVQDRVKDDGITGKDADPTLTMRKNL